MKKLSLVLNVVLIIAVGVLYALHFTGNNKTTGDTNTNSSAVNEVTVDYAIAYVNFDSLLINYQMYMDKRDDLMQKRDESEAELQTETQKLERQFADFQDKVSKGLITRTKAQMMQQELGQQEQQLYQLKDNLTYQLAEEEQVMNRQVMYNITEYLKEFNKTHNYKYIFSNTFGGPFLFSDDRLDITVNVLDGLNESYKEETEK